MLCLFVERQRHAVEHRELVAARLQVHVNQRDQHQERSDERVQEEFDGGRTLAAGRPQTPMIDETSG